MSSANKTPQGPDRVLHDNAKLAAAVKIYDAAIRQIEEDQSPQSSGWITFVEVEKHILDKKYSVRHLRRDLSSEPPRPDR